MKYFNEIMPEINNEDYNNEELINIKIKLIE